MSDSKYTVYHVGLHPRDILDNEAAEVEKAGGSHGLINDFESDDELIERARDADGLVIVHDAITRKILESLPNLKVVVRSGVGIDTIDVEAATELGVAVVNVPDLWSREVANHAFSMLLALSRKLLILDRGVTNGDWTPIIPPHVGPLHGETLGLVSMGRIGRAMAARAHAFEMDVVAYDPYLPESAFKEADVESVEVDDILRRSDYVSIHSPLTSETKHLFNEEAFKKMKPTALILNTARGPVIEHKALVRALQEGWIAGAGLDVLETEPPDPNDPLLKMDNVIVTPHTAYYSATSVADLPIRCGQEVARVLMGRKPLNLVNPAVLDRLPLAD